LIKVAFWYDRPQEYTGGLNYLRNLLFALSRLDKKMIKPYIFFGTWVDDEIVRPFESLATVVRTSILDRKSPAWFLHQILFRFFGSLLIIRIAIQRHGISIISHAHRVYGKSRSFRIISWIPDFQYLHLPELFPSLDTAAETKRIRTIAATSDALILSSHAALSDFRRISDPTNTVSVTVLQFVSQPSSALQNAGELPTRTKIEAKYDFQGRYFFLPNQFWQHKNHIVAFRAVKILKEQGIDALLICSGNLRDYRMKDTYTSYVDGLQQFARDNHLNHSIIILGMIDYADVLSLMRHCVAVINPSRFEGWSSTVEEAKSMGKRLILSSIPVHREQDPSGALFFDPDDAEALAQAMATLWTSPTDAISAEDEQRAAEDLEQRTLAYAAGYSCVVSGLCGANGGVHFKSGARN
jgi:glycosyltransferase involved in cell wall biosynthesis